MKAKLFIILLFCGIIYSGTVEDKDIVTNSVRVNGVWLDNTIPWYDLYRDPSLPDSFRIILQDACDHVEPSSVISQYYSFNYTDILDSQRMYDNKCQVKYANYGLEFIAKCCTPMYPEYNTVTRQYVGEILEFDILINNLYSWTTGCFGTQDVYDREHSMRHEISHGIGCGHNYQSFLMKSADGYDNFNPQRYITDIDRYNYHAVYNPPSIIKPQKPTTGYCEFLLKHGGNIHIEATKPTIVDTDSAQIGFHLLNADNTYKMILKEYTSYLASQQKYSYDWIIDTLVVKNKPYKINTMYSGLFSQDFIDEYKHDELKIRFSNLAFESPKKDSSYISYSTLNFKVFGKSDSANVAIKDIDRIGSVTYLLVKDDFLKTEIFKPTETDSLTDFQFNFDLSTSEEEITNGTYLVSATVKDTDGAVIAEIIRMPIKLEFERNCRVDFPLPSSESWFDFETRLNAAGSILAEPSFADSLDNVYVIFDIYDDYWSAYLTELFQEEYHLSIFSEVYAENNLFIDSNVYFCDFEKKAKTLQLDRRFPTHDLKSMTDKMNAKRFIEHQKPNISKNNSKDLTVYPAEPYRYRYPKSLDLWPGSYTVHMIAFRKDIWDTYGIVSEIAKCDSMQFIIPLWKMKLRRDYWYANTVVPYKQNLEYEAGKTMQILLWQPISWGHYNILNIDVVRETDSTVVDNFTVDFDDKAAGVLVEWDIPAETVPGFYNLKASNVDYYTNIPVNQQIDPQVCPLYLSWENYGDWPDNWPGSDNADWKIQGAPWTPAMGAYALGAKYSTEGNTGQVSIQKSFSIDSEWDRILEFAIGVPKFYGVTNFDPLLADYSIAISEDGANWTYEKAAAISEYYNYNWAVDTMHCFNKTIKPLGKPSNIFVKFIKKGIVTTPPDSQFVLFDEVKVMLTKTPTKTGPSDPNAQYAGGNVNVGWSGVAKGDKALDNYYVYRNGIKIGETTAVTFVDSTVSANTFYNYAITAHYDDGSTYPESPMNECSVSIYTGLFAPSNLVITNENPNIKLTWSPISGASEYKVYSSNDPYGTFAEDLSGTFDGEEWIAPLSSSRLFYYVVAVNESMKEKKNIKDINHRVK